VLATEYRPRTFGEVAGQRPVAAVLYRMVRRRKVPAALLFHGPHGSGKTSMARIVTAALNCSEEPGDGGGGNWPCGHCPSCMAVWAGTSLDLLEVDAASNGTIDHVRHIRDLVQYGTPGEWRTVVLDEAHGLSGPGSEALLKVFEEPPPRTTFILATTEPRKISRTLSSRCLPFPFDPISPAVIRTRLEYICTSERITVEPELLAAISERADGALRDAVMLLEQVADVGITSLEDWRELTGETDFAPALIAAAADGDYQQLYARLDEAICASGDYGSVASRIVSVLRDLLVLSVDGGAVVAARGQALELRRALARRLGAPAIVDAMRVLWDLQVRVRSDDRRSSLELAAVMLAEKLRPVPRVAAVSPGAVPASDGELSAILRPA
jgi:DNA polymerase III subunit gamma/tau